MNSVNTHLYFPEDLYREVAALARREAVPVAKMIRDLVADGVNKKTKTARLKQGQKSPGYYALEGLTKLGIKYPKGLNLSKNHDKYIVEAFEDKLKRGKNA